MTRPSIVKQEAMASLLNFLRSRTCSRMASIGLPRANTDLLEFQGYLVARGTPGGEHPQARATAAHLGELLAVERRSPFISRLNSQARATLLELVRNGTPCSSRGAILDRVDRSHQTSSQCLPARRAAEKAIAQFNGRERRSTVPTSPVTLGEDRSSSPASSGLEKRKRSSLHEREGEQEDRRVKRGRHEEPVSEQEVALDDGDGDALMSDVSQASADADSESGGSLLWEGESSGEEEKELAILGLTRMEIWESILAERLLFGEREEESEEEEEEREEVDEEAERAREAESLRDALWASAQDIWAGLGPVEAEAAMEEYLVGMVEDGNLDGRFFKVLTDIPSKRRVVVSHPYQVRIAPLLTSNTLAEVVAIFGEEGDPGEGSSTGGQGTRRASYLMGRGFTEYFNGVKGGEL
ncbi:hypothetical protein TWF730_000326 [Orbilia blumenaviensis]|uniref:Uncharacterized protein n=1 Tax=Orbilia blumenaviensis TaxID=1796055 RepID=A0AAV9VNG3_9PEZI